MKILCIPVSLVGAINATTALAEALQKRGHEITFAIDVNLKGKLASKGFNEITYKAFLTREGEEEVSVKNFVIDLINKNKAVIQLPTIEAFPRLWANHAKVLESFKSIDPQIFEIINEIKPDIIINSNASIPCIVTSGIPWLYLHTANPLFLHEDNDVLPPGGSGYSQVKDEIRWSEFVAVKKTLHKNAFGAFLDWYESQGASPKGIGVFLNTSEYLNVYIYPEELDYTDVRPLGPNFIRMDATIRKDNEIFEIPEKLKDLPGKLIYLSLGSMGSVDVDLMKSLTIKLGKSKNRFIVSKGLLHEKYELPDNMWGAEFLPQIKVLQAVDLFITHGGNNSITEGMYFGKPMIVLPLFSDQPDNAMRVKEKAFGESFNPYFVTEDELLGAIDRLLNDQDLHARLAKASERIQNSKSTEAVIERIEALKK